MIANKLEADGCYRIEKSGSEEKITETKQFKFYRGYNTH